ncbi:unnamed protein product, partial [Lymnaea stagnalis]
QVISVICLAFYMLRYIALDEMRDSIELKGIVYAGFVLYSFLIGVSLILLPGVYMDRKFLLLPWIYVLVITVLYETGAIALITTVHLEQEHTLDAWEIVAVVFYCIRLIANCYCFACVVSQYQELTEGRGTYEFLFKPWRRQIARTAHLPDFDEYNPPYGATLPPYSEDNPFKEYSPPNYDNVVQEGGESNRASSRVSVQCEVTRHIRPASQHTAEGVRTATTGSYDDISLSGSADTCIEYTDLRHLPNLHRHLDRSGYSSETLSSTLSPLHSRTSSFLSDDASSQNSVPYSNRRSHDKSLNDSGIAMTPSSGRLLEFLERDDIWSN